MFDLKNRKSFVTLMLIMTVLFQTISSAKLPVIGIVSIPKFMDEKDPTKYETTGISPTYVKWLEASGAESLVIHPWYTPDEIDKILNKVNGVVLQGSLYTYDLKTANPYIDTVLYILVSLNSRREGEKVPLIGIDDGFLLLNQLYSDGENWIREYKNYNVSSKLQFDLDRVKTTKLFSLFTKTDLNILRSNKVAYNLNHYGIHPTAYDDNEGLRKFFRVTSTARDDDGKTFVTSVEAYDYPIYGIHFRPDAVSYLRKYDLDVPNTYEAIRAARGFGNFFVQNCKENNKNKLEDADYVLYSFIDPYNHSPIFDIAVDNFVYSFEKPKDR